MNTFLTLISLFLILNLNADRSSLSTEKIEMRDSGSGRIFKVTVSEDEGGITIKANSGLLFLEEYYSTEGDTFFLTGRKFGFGAASKKFVYYPPRIRMIFPLEECKSWVYEGEERSFGYNKKIKSEGFVSKDSTGFTVFNITRREGLPDTSILMLDNMKRLEGMRISIPKIPFIKQMIGTKEEYLLLKRYDTP